MSDRQEFIPAKVEARIVWPKLPEIDPEVAQAFGAALEKVASEQIAALFGLPSYLFDPLVLRVQATHMLVIGTAEHFVIATAVKLLPDGRIHVWTTTGTEEDFANDAPSFLIRKAEWNPEFRPSPDLFPPIFWRHEVYGSGGVWPAP